VFHRDKFMSHIIAVESETITDTRTHEVTDPDHCT
jgi:hypothetical protein